MIKERPVNPALKTLLVDNKPHQYAHLIKFERPSKAEPHTGVVSTSAERYTYITDASRNVRFNDGSTDLQGNPNGEQIYIANKVLKVGSIQETTEATAGSTNIELDGNAVGAIAEEYVEITSVNSTTWDIKWPEFVYPVLNGFREGDKVALKYDTVTDEIIQVNIHSFRADNVVRVTKIDQNVLTTPSDYLIMTLSSEEILSILLDKNTADYASFINREVFIYRAYFVDGTVVGEPILVFKGIINRVAFDDNENDITVSWGLTSHWGDFAKVKGRITSDSYHRALDADGIPQPFSAIKPTYAYDKGFMHSENAINMLATYIVQVEKTKVKAKSGFFGIGAKTKVKTYLVPEERNTDLDFQLQSKAIPVVYGVRSVEGIKVFADTLDDDSATVYIIYALSEGEIGAIYDTIIDGNSLICNDKADFDARSSQTSDNTVELICRGRADAGDVLGPSTVSEPAGAITNFYEDISYFGNINNFLSNLPYATNYKPPATYNDDAGANKVGITHGDVVRLTNPQELEMELFSGKTGQQASSVLVDLAFNSKLKIQNSYWTGNGTSEYWGPNHRLLDTAYVLAKVVIKEGETTIPELNFIIKGKALQCYNYDYSYIHHPYVSGENADIFDIGDTVNIRTYPAHAIINNQVQIIDKWTITNPDGTKSTRFRFSEVPNLGYDENGVPSIKEFCIEKSSQYWTMVTYNYTPLSGLVTASISSPITAVSNEGSKLGISYTADNNMAVESTELENTPTLSIVDSNLDNITDNNLLGSLVFTGSTITSSKIISKLPYSYLEDMGTVVGKHIASRNTVKLPSGASNVNDYYKGKLVQITRYTSFGKKITQTEEIVGYHGGSRIATIDSIWGFIPKNGDTCTILEKYNDIRCSINPAIQTLDYVTSPTYGRGLDIDNDLDKPSWFESARECDKQSDVTLKVATNLGSLAVGDVYQLNVTSKFQWQGKVSAINAPYVTFTDVIGKVTHKHFTWKDYKPGNIVYDDSGSMYVVPVAGKYTPASGNITSSIYLAKISGSGPGGLNLNIDGGNPVKGIRNGKEISGYTLYDCDSVNYWRLTGWDEHSQRYVTKHQTNLSLDTSTPIFDNTNSLLSHFNGIMRYSAGKYYLDIENQEPVIPPGNIRNITSDDIIGRIQISDEGVRSSYNSLTVAFPDPASRFEARNISFFNSDYLSIDKNVPKKGNLSLPGITNYYNARLLSDTFLTKSRFGLTVSFTIRTHGILFLAGTVIELTYPRYNWDNKPFRISTVTHQPDGYTDIVAKEYDDAFYSLTRLYRAEGSGLTSKTRRVISVGPPDNLKVTGQDYNNELFNTIELTWENNPKATPSNVSTEIYSSSSVELFLDIDTINNNIMTTIESDHTLVPGMAVFPATNYLTEISPNKIYYVRETSANNPSLADNQFTLSESRPETGGALPPLLNLSSSNTPNLKIRSAVLVNTVSVPINTYKDTLAEVDPLARVTKYYWIRHKVTE